MCQLRVTLLLADNRQEQLEEVTHIHIAPDKITLASLFEAPRELHGFDIKEIDCLHNRLLLVQRTPDLQGEQRHG